jgi:hypothetical protein
VPDDVGGDGGQRHRTPPAIPRHLGRAGRRHGGQRGVGHRDQTGQQHQNERVDQQLHIGQAGRRGRK